MGESPIEQPEHGMLVEIDRLERELSNTRAVLRELVDAVEANHVSGLDGTPIQERLDRALAAAREGM